MPLPLIPIRAAASMKALLGVLQTEVTWVSRISTVPWTFCTGNNSNFSLYLNLQTLQSSEIYPLIHPSGVLQQWSPTAFQRSLQLRIHKPPTSVQRQAFKIRTSLQSNYLLTFLQSHFLGRPQTSSVWVWCPPLSWEAQHLPWQIALVLQTCSDKRCLQYIGLHFMSIMQCPITFTLQSESISAYNTSAFMYAAIICACIVVLVSMNHWHVDSTKPWPPGLYPRQTFSLILMP